MHSTFCGAEVIHILQKSFVGALLLPPNLYKHLLSGMSSLYEPYENYVRSLKSIDCYRDNYILVIILTSMMQHIHYTLISVLVSTYFQFGPLQCNVDLTTQVETRDKEPRLEPNSINSSLYGFTTPILVAYYSQKFLMIRFNNKLYLFIR